MKPLIVGIDPGTTSAYAVLDFNFNLVAVDSKRNFPLSEIITSVFHLGDPILVAADKKEIPSLVEDFSRKLGAKTFTPSYDMKKGEKKRMVKVNNFSKYVNNAHETDALAAAIYAFKDYRQLIKKIKYTLRKEKKQQLKDKVISIVILEEISIKKAIDSIVNKKEKTTAKITKKRKKQLSLKKELSSEEKQILLLKTQNLKLKQKISKLKNELKKQQNKKINIGKKVKKMLSFKEKRILYFEAELKKKSMRIRKLNKKFQKLKQIIPLINQSVLIKKIDNLSKEEFKKTDIYINDYLLIDDLSVFSKSVLKELNDKNIRVLIFNKKSNKILEKNFILIKKEKIKIKKELKDYAFADRTNLTSVVRNKIKNQKHREDMIKDIIEEYRKERIDV
ncbi:DUF460 domain-containing protein [Candidatus Woesearchaeota archaeon]|nr:DUF460 domain-containing protein [Candidatus Woesearchaeota archaeon]